MGKEMLDLTVRSIVERVLEKEGIDAEAKLTDLGADSLDVLEMAMECEKEFGITVPDETITPEDMTLKSLTEQVRELYEKKEPV